MEISILANGRVQSVKTVKTHIPDKAMLACMKAKISKWKFPAAKNLKRTKLTYPFIFSSSKNKVARKLKFSYPDR